MVIFPGRKKREEIKNRQEKEVDEKIERGLLDFSDEINQESIDEGGNPQEDVGCLKQGGNPQEDVGCLEQDGNHREDVGCLKHLEKDEMFEDVTDN